MQGAEGLRILTVHWNSDGLRLCETSSQVRADDRRGFFAWRSSCTAPDFFEEIRKFIIENRPDVVVIGTEEAGSKTYFHAEFLSTRMPEIGYALLKRSKTDEVNRHTIRLSVFSKQELVATLTLEERSLDKLVGGKGQISLICGAAGQNTGAVGCYIWHPLYGHFAFLYLRLREAVKDLVGDPGTVRRYYETVKAANQLCLSNMLRYFIDDLPVQAKPDHIIVMGDFNARLTIDRPPQQVIQELKNATQQKLRELHEYDDVRKLIQDGPLRGFNEGVSNGGPLFLPTWKLRANRPAICTTSAEHQDLASPLQCFDITTMPAWSDRILYTEVGESSYTLQCVYYARLDVGSISKSSHAAIMALFDTIPK